MTRVITTAALVSMLAAFPVMAADNDLVGTYKLVIEQRTIVDTGEVIPVKNPQGYITYGGDGRMMVIIVRHPRPRPESIETFDRTNVAIASGSESTTPSRTTDPTWFTTQIDVCFNDTSSPT
jgi:hypothetical protein